MATEFCFISVPKREKVNISSLLGQQTSLTGSLDVPQLRVGTLNSLMTLSDDLVKLDHLVEATFTKIRRQLAELTGSQDFHVSVGQEHVPYESYLTRFKWNTAQYNVKKSLKELADLCHSKCQMLSEELKTKSAKFQSVRVALSTIQRKETGTLVVRDLSDLVSKSDMIESEYLITLCVVVPKYLYKDWLATYETLGDCKHVVPRSSQLLYEDGEFGLYSVTLFKREADDYRMHCQKNRFIVREPFVRAKNADGEEEQIITSKEEKQRLRSEEEELRNDLLRWCNVSISESMTAWTHLKAIRLYVESILRYGLPPDFNIYVIRYRVKFFKKIMDTLCRQFDHLGIGDAFSGVMEKEDQMHASSLGGMEFYPFVCVTMHVEDGEAA